MRMWLPVSTFAALCFLIDFADGTPTDHRQLERIFQERSHSDWEEAWHRERYSRCRETLLRHLYWACEKDIYRLTRRSQYSDIAAPYSDENDYRYPWINEKNALNLIRTRRGSQRRSGSSSITSECCSPIGCTWEEYAEYCPTNKRKTFI